MLKEEVMRLMQLSPGEIDRHLQEELNCMPPTAKAPPVDFVPAVPKRFLPPTAKFVPKRLGYAMLKTNTHVTMPRDTSDPRSTTCAN